MQALKATNWNIKYPDIIAGSVLQQTLIPSAVLRKESPGHTRLLSVQYKPQD